MMPGMNPNMMKKLMKNLNLEEISAEKVIIRTKEHDVVITNPSVSRMNAGGRVIFQVSGKEKKMPRESKEPEVLKEDIDVVVEKTGVSEEEAEKAIVASHGDLAEAIMKLKK